MVHKVRDQGVNKEKKKESWEQKVPKTGDTAQQLKKGNQTDAIGLNRRKGSKGGHPEILEAYGTEIWSLSPSAQATTAVTGGAPDCDIRNHWGAKS